LKLENSALDWVPTVRSSEVISCHFVPNECVTLKAGTELPAVIPVMFCRQWVLNSNNTLQKLASANSSVTLALLSGMAHVVGICSRFLPVALARSCCSASFTSVRDTCVCFLCETCAGKHNRMSVNLKQRFSANQREMLG